MTHDLPAEICGLSKGKAPQGGDRLVADRVKGLRGAFLVHRLW